MGVGNCGSRVCPLGSHRVAPLMIWSALQALWHFLFGWAGVDILIGIAAVALAILEPPLVAALIPDLRKWAICTAVVAFTLTAWGAYEYRNGFNERDRQLLGQLAKEARDGSQILTDAERDARADTPDSLRNDSWNRGSRIRPTVH